MCQTCAWPAAPVKLSRNRINMPMRLRANSAPSGLNSVPTPSTRAAEISVSQATVLSSPAFASNELVSVPPLSTTVA